MLKRYFYWLIVILLFLLCTVSLFSIQQGTVALTFEQIIAIFAHMMGIQTSTHFTPLQQAVVLDIRLPRTLLGIVVGSSLAICGVAMQGLFRNPLADPTLIGVSSGASLAAVTMIVLGNSLLAPIVQSLGFYALPIAAFIGGFITTFLVYHLAKLDNGETSVTTLLLAGIAINALTSSMTHILIYLANNDQLRTLTLWQMGNLANTTWTEIFSCLPFLLITAILLLTYGRALNALLLGEREAHYLGFDTTRLTRHLLILVALTVGVTVAVAGIIGFIGLVVPHLLRLLLGANHRLLLPTSLLLGAILLVSADICARLLVAPAELPIGILTAMLGAPFFIGLLWQKRQTLGY